MMHNTPIVRLELEHMKYQVLHALAEHHAEIRRHAEEQLQVAIDTFDFPAVVRRVAKEEIELAIKSAIESYFRYGEGYKAICEMVAEAIKIHGKVQG